MSINRVNLSGNLTRDPEISDNGKGVSILKFGIAVNDRKRNSQTGEWEDYANFIECTLFGNRAEPLSKLMYKGMKVAIEGKLRYSSWEKDGQRRSKIEVVVDEVELLQQKQNQNYSQPQEQYQRPENDGQDVYEEDIPF